MQLRPLICRGMLFAGLALGASVAFAEPVSVRWTYQDATPGGGDTDLTAVLDGIAARTGHRLPTEAWTLSEDRPLAYSRYRRYDQLVEGERVEGMSIRIWTRGSEPAGDLLQVEARFDPQTADQQARQATRALGLVGFDTRAARAAAMALVAAASDRGVRSVEEDTVWSDGRLLRIVKVKARRGVHEIRFDLLSGGVVSQRYRPFARADADGHLDVDDNAADYFDLPALVYPVYEEWQGSVLERQPVLLRHIAKQLRLPASDQDPYASLRDRRYLYSLLDPVRGETAAGQAQGYWSSDWLRRRAAAIETQIPLTDNSLATGQAVLHGRYATVNIHPEAFAAFPATSLPRRYGPYASYAWREVAGGDGQQEPDYEVVPSGSFLGKPLTDAGAAAARDASRHPQHDAAFYMDSGFDEVQVYYAINQLFDSLRPKGFLDPDLGERPFHAFLFDPDVENRDNAFYDADTINFSTYSPDSLNFARDNTTIWHELGHGVMDRLMGTRLELADTGGLSEGMADFVAELVLRDAWGETSFPGADQMRIVNQTGFFLTNEAHDDGEAYGGAMKAILDGAVQRYGRRGLTMITDLVLEAMRLSRDHPALTAPLWFEHVRFADAIGREGLRQPGQLRAVIDEALASRNFFDGEARGVFTLSYQDHEVNAGDAGSRDNEIRLELAADAQHSETITVHVADGSSYRFQWPVEVRVFFNSGPLQGAIDWQGEDSEPLVYTLDGPDATLAIPLTVSGTCDAINRNDGSCSDFAYVQVWNAGASYPVAKKRFYLRITTLPAP